MRRTLILLAVLILVSATVADASSGYVVILKNGHQIRAKEPLRIEGRTAIITLSNGTITSYPVEHVDLVETQKYNQRDLGDAIEIKELALTNDAMPTPTPRKSLGHFATITPLEGNAELGTQSTPTPIPTPGIKLQNVGYREPRITRAFSQYLDQSKLYLYKTSVGTRPEYFFIQVIADDEAQVFDALRIVTEAYSLINERTPEITPAAVELEMISTGHNAAGTFRITPEMSNELTGGQISAEQFYVKNVIF